MERNEKALLDWLNTYEKGLVEEILRDLPMTHGMLFAALGELERKDLARISRENGKIVIARNKVHENPEEPGPSPIISWEQKNHDKSDIVELPQQEDYIPAPDQSSILQWENSPTATNPSIDLMENPVNELEENVPENNHTRIEPEIHREIKHTFTCSNCGAELTNEFEICNKCNYDHDTCAICKTSTEVYRCENCRRSFHLSHIVMYVKKERQCPICKVSLDLLSIVKQISSQN
ncbi:MAG: hypothetical protein INQ03_12425 [Candidatus Heimdallarchaeota archaeon]|nr:hypothetical protein [Candidatus Heimdallarchaeota archaeon]